MNQVHKETLTNVDNSLPNRQGLEVEIFGMEGIPEDVVQAHNQRIIAVYYQAEAERRAVTGNPGPGGSANTNGQSKKPKHESPAELKKRLAEHKARKAEQAATGASSNSGNTPRAVEQNSPMGRSPGSYVCLFFLDVTNANKFQNATPLTQSQPAYNGSPNAGFGPFSQEPFAQPAVAFQQPFSPQNTFSGPPGTQFHSQFSPTQQYPTTQSFPSTFPPGQNFANGPQFGAAPSQTSLNGFQQTPLQVPPQHSGLPNQPPSLPPAPGLPQRPSFGAPAVPSYQMQQLHQGSWTSNGWKGHEQKPSMSSAYPHPPGYMEDLSNNSTSVSDLIPGNVRETDDIDKIIRMAEAGIKPPKVSEPSVNEQSSNTTEVSPPQPSEKPEIEKDKQDSGEKKQKKEKPVKMIYSDNTLSPEEKLAKMPRYAFIPDGKTESSLLDIATSSLEPQTSHS